MGVPEKKPEPAWKKLVPAWTTLFIIGGILFVLAAIATPKFAGARHRANTRACYANQKTIVGAIEMYNLDKKTKVTELSVALPALKSGGYLISVPDDPGEGRETSDHYKLTTTGNGISCRVHGSIQ